MARRLMELKVVSLDRVYRPVPMETLVRLATEGRISAEDLVRPAGTEAWCRVDQVPSLAAGLPRRAGAEPGAAGDELDAAGGGWTPLRAGPQPEEAAMDMAPMIDVTFLLLIFFMLTNSLANPSPMDVPTAVHGRGVTLEGQQLILIDQQGKYYLGDRAKSENLAGDVDALIREVQQNAGRSEMPLDVILSAHKTTKHVRVRELIEALGSLDGLGRVMLGVEEKHE
jgi:biopolymer transport protein ExbD